MSDRVQSADGIIGYGSDREVEDISLAVTEDATAVADIELAGGDIERIALTREQAEAFREMIAESYQEFDRTDGQEVEER